MVIDPRNLLPVKVPSKCHLIPECFGVSNRTVPLDGPFDNRIGEQCDSHLHTYFRLLVGDELKGDFAFERGSKSVAGSMYPRASQFRIKKPRRGLAADWAQRALGMQGNRIEFKEFVTAPVDMAKARLSMVNSAFLILHYLARPEIFEPSFDRARDLLKKVISDSLVSADLPDIETLTPEVGMVYVNAEKTKGLTTIGPSDLRRLYDPMWEPGDGLLVDFPYQSVSEQADTLVVRLPYGNCLRGAVRFPLGVAGAGEGPVATG